MKHWLIWNVTTRTLTDVTIIRSHTSVSTVTGRQTGIVTMMIPCILPETGTVPGPKAETTVQVTSFIFGKSGGITSSTFDRLVFTLKLIYFDKCKNLQNYSQCLYKKVICLI